jgi:hypothetical protein
MGGIRVLYEQDEDGALFDETARFDLTPADSIDELARFGRSLLVVESDFTTKEAVTHYARRRDR